MADKQVYPIEATKRNPDLATYGKIGSRKVIPLHMSVDITDSTRAAVNTKLDSLFAANSTDPNVTGLLLVELRLFHKDGQRRGTSYVADATFQYVDFSDDFNWKANLGAPFGTVKSRTVDIKIPRADSYSDGQEIALDDSGEICWTTATLAIRDIHMREDVTDSDVDLYSSAENKVNAANWYGLQPGTVLYVSKDAALYETTSDDYYQRLSHHFQYRYWVCSTTVGSVPAWASVSPFATIGYARNSDTGRMEIADITSTTPDSVAAPPFPMPL
jgi:hypothetical protein